MSGLAPLPPGGLQPSAPPQHTEGELPPAAPAALAGRRASLEGVSTLEGQVSIPRLATPYLYGLKMHTVTLRYESPSGLWEWIKSFFSWTDAGKDYAAKCILDKLDQEEEAAKMAPVSGSMSEVKESAALLSEKTRLSRIQDAYNTASERSKWRFKLEEARVLLEQGHDFKAEDALGQVDKAKQDLAEVHFMRAVINQHQIHFGKAYQEYKEVNKLIASQVVNDYFRDASKKGLDNVVKVITERGLSALAKLDGEEKLAFVQCMDMDARSYKLDGEEKLAFVQCMDMDERSYSVLNALKKEETEKGKEAWATLAERMSKSGKAIDNSVKLDLGIYYSQKSPPTNNLHAEKWLKEVAEHGTVKEKRDAFGALFKMNRTPEHSLHRARAEVEGDGSQEATDALADYYKYLSQMSPERYRDMAIETLRTLTGDTAKETRELLVWQRDAAKHNADAMYKLGRVYQQGLHGLPQNLDQAKSLYQAAYDREHKEAAFELGNITLRECTPQNYEEQLGKAAKYFHDGFQRNPHTSRLKDASIDLDMAFYERYTSFSGISGNSREIHNLAACFYNGTDSFPKNDEISWKLMELAASKGNPSARYELGAAYERGSYGYRTIKRDAVKAFDYYDSARPSSYEWTGGSYDAALRLARCYIFGELNQAIDYQRAKSCITFITKNARSIEDGRLTEAIYLMEIVNEREREYQKALNSYYEAAQKGNADGMYAYAKFILTPNAYSLTLPKGDEDRNKESQEWLKRAADAGHAQARKELEG